MGRSWDVLTFDCYGTLIDWDGGIAGAFAAAAAADGVALDLDAALRAFAEIEPQVQIERFRSYRDVLTETARRVGARAGWLMSPERAAFLARSLPDWRPFPDTNPALERLAAAGYRLGILSNVDDELLAGTRRHLTVPFEIIVTAQQVRSYKPGRGHFTTARERIGGARWLHVAQSHFHDVTPCLDLGIPVAWINRKGEPMPARGAPLRELPSLAALADWLA
jgi:2-haloacid dehalogenase/putative hydrolase of the HAD superfamily